MFYLRLFIKRLFLPNTLILKTRFSLKETIFLNLVAHCDELKLCCELNEDCKGNKISFNLQSVKLITALNYLEYVYV